MNRAFISLYFFIVASVVLIGWGLNQFWESVAPEQEPTAEIHALFALIEDNLLTQQPQSDTGYTQAAQQLSRQLNLTLELLVLDDLAQSAAMHELHAGKILAASSNGDIIWYKRLAQTDQVVMLSIPVSDESESPFYRLLLIVFYLAIALVIYLWVWPLSRDSKKLESQTRTLGKDGVPETLKISPTSTLYPLAQAFNHMAQRLRELIASHREMTNAVSHELRTPLARMKFALAMIEEEKLNDKDRRQLRSVEQDIAEMESLISALLAYAGFEQKTQQLKQTSGHMRDLLDELQLRFARHNQRHLQLDICDLSNNEKFVCEWKLIETVLQNFINNAARYAKSRIRIELMQTQSEYIIAVEDDGPGIPADKRERVFESFVRLYHEEQNENTAGSATGGFGLGLAIVKRIMQWHHGTAQFVEPEVLGGARAQIRWPKKLLN
ncbi:ATP-binding protein [Cellvibrio fibrivorans]|uniref:histidine kinase n=1 Tax=Cellvibrio fibrivorans TaxID=126350 RepID=A0ABU1UUM8_9GAMM|nr:ATP-binding protein [Cellvibrio fibrivorans]MDR7088870.1 signal transduction histidine kinase [Cellvibrio fibrivorans]